MDKKSFRSGMVHFHSLIEAEKINKSLRLITWYREVPPRMGTPYLDFSMKYFEPSFIYSPPEFSHFHSVREKNINLVSFRIDQSTSRD